MTLRARVIDPVPSLSRRLLPYVPVLGLGIAGVAVGSASIVLASLALAHLAGLASGRARSYDAELRTGPGCVEIVRGWRRRKVTAKQIAGASTARLGDKLSLALSLERRAEVPLLFSLDSERDAARVREALGVGHHGYGRVQYPLAPGAATSGGLLARMLGALFWAILAFLPGGAMMLPVALFVSCLALLCSMVWLGFVLAAPTLGQAVVMAPDGVRTRTPGLDVIAYGSIKGVRDDERSLRFDLTDMSRPSAQLAAPEPRRSRFMLDREQRAHLLAQIMAAAQRARGAGPVKEEVAQRLEPLRRRGASAKEWLERLDVTARMLADEQSYRAAPILRDDLWAALEDPDGDADLRAAAARVLLGVDPSARVRVDATLAAVRDDVTETKIRIAMEPLEQASRELERYERPLLNVLPIPGASTPGPGFHREPPR